MYFEMFDFIQLFDPMGGDCASRVVCLRAVVCCGDIMCHYCTKIFNRLWPMQVLLDSSWSACGGRQWRGRRVREDGDWMESTIIWAVAGDCCASGRYRSKRMDNQGMERDGAI